MRKSGRCYVAIRRRAADAPREAFKVLAGVDIGLDDISRSLHRMERCGDRAEAAYRDLLKTHPDYPRLLQASSGEGSLRVTLRSGRSTSHKDALCSLNRGGAAGGESRGHEGPLWLGLTCLPFHSAFSQMYSRFQEEVQANLSVSQHYQKLAETYEDKMRAKAEQLAGQQEDTMVQGLHQKKLSNIDEARDAVVVISTDGNIIFANRNLCEMFG